MSPINVSICLVHQSGPYVASCGILLSFCSTPLRGGSLDFSSSDSVFYPSFYPLWSCPFCLSSPFIHLVLAQQHQLTANRQLRQMLLDLCFIVNTIRKNSKAIMHVPLFTCQTFWVVPESLGDLYKRSQSCWIRNHTYC